MSLNFYYMSFNILNNIFMLWNFDYVSYNFLNNIFMLGAHLIYVKLFSNNIYMLAICLFFVTQKICTCYWSPWHKRGSSRIFGDSSITLAQWWRVRHLRHLVIRRSPVRFRPKIRQLRFTWIWVNRPSSKGSKLLFPVIKAI